MRIKELDETIRVFAEMMARPDWEEFNYTYKSKIIKANNLLLDANEAFE